MIKTAHMSKEEVEKRWYLIDANGKVLGRLASEIAKILRGKKKAIFSPHVDTGDFVIVVNAEKVKLTGDKLKGKLYYHHSGYPGGLKAVAAEKLLANKPEELLRRAVKGMLPKNKLGNKVFKKLKVYAGSKHPHEAQQPKQVQL
jgi:large subunit ribosomal protein L13